MRLFKVKLIGNDAPLYLKGNTLTDALEGAGHGRDVFDVLETVTEIEEAIAMLNAFLTQNSTEDEMVKMAQMVLHERMVQGRLESDYDWDDDDWDDDDSDDDEDWEGDDLISLIGK